MERHNEDLAKILEKITENLMLSNFQDLKDIANSLKPNLCQPILAITELFESTIHQSSKLQTDVFFYGDFIKSMIKGEYSEEKIMKCKDVMPVKREEALKLMKKFKDYEQQKTALINELDQTKKQIQSIKAESSIQKVKVEKEVVEVKSKISQLVADYQLQIKELTMNIESQAQMLKSSLENEETNSWRIEQTEKENAKLTVRSNFLQRQVRDLEGQLTNLQQDIRKSTLKENQSLTESRILSQQIKEQQQTITSLKSIENKYKSQISTCQQQNRTLRQEIEQLRTKIQKNQQNKFVKRRSDKQMFIDRNSILQILKADDQLSETFQQTLTSKVGQVSSMSSLYNYSLHKSQNFHKRVDEKKNVLLLCLTKDRRILGGFSSSGFSLKSEQKHTKAFLFSFYHDKMKIFDLKKGKSSTIYDRDFLLFGNEELCIEKGSDNLSSSFVNGSKNSLHYHCDNIDDKYTFLSLSDKGTSSVRLQNFEIIELSIKND